MHAAALAFASDCLSQGSAGLRLGRGFGPGSFASRDHVLHAHRPARRDEWWLLDSASEVARDGRAHWQRRVFARDGTLIASVAQEALIREP